MIYFELQEDHMLPEQIFTTEDVAKYLRVPAEAVESEIASGKLKSINVAGYVRIREFDLAGYMNEARTRVSGASDIPEKEFRLRLHSAPDFSHRWPDGSIEHYSNVAEGVATFHKSDYQVKIGFTQRLSAGQLRVRSLVLVDRYPSVEFVASSSEVQPESRMASIIKDRNGKQLPLGAELPPEYVGKTVGSYRSVVDGPGARNGAAVICESRDLETMAEHGVIRYKFRDERE